MFPAPSSHPMTTRFKTMVKEIFKQYGYKDPQKRPRTSDADEEEENNRYKQRRINDDNVMDVDT